jgi:hypothetical protein
VAPARPLTPEQQNNSTDTPQQWKPVYLVLRPNYLSIYKDKAGTKLRHQINLAEITAVARQKDAKKKMAHVFGVFSPARNFHLAASTDKDAQAWVDLIRTEARMDDDEGDMVLLSPTGNKTFTGFDRRRDRISSSSDAEPRTIAPDTVAPDTAAPTVAPSNHRRPSQALNYSGNERGSVSDFDFSDTANSLPHRQIDDSQQHKPTQQSAVGNIPNVSQQSNINKTPGEDRVVYHGWLYVLKSKGGVRQWKKVWVVLRPKCLAFYKNDQEYSANLIIPFAHIIDAVDIDSVSRSKQYCMQVISEDKNFRFCAPDENSLAMWLGAFKSLLIKRKEGQKRTEVPRTEVPRIEPAPKPAAPTQPLAVQPV